MGVHGLWGCHGEQEGRCHSPCPHYGGARVTVMASVPNTAHVHVKNGTCLALLIPCHLHLHLIVAHGQDVANTRGCLAFYSLFSPSVCSRVTKANFSVTHVRNDSDTECERGANLLGKFFVVIGGREGVVGDCIMGILSKKIHTNFNKVTCWHYRHCRNSDWII